MPPTPATQRPRRHSRLVDPAGVSWYVGAPGTGKTTLAVSHARMIAGARQVPTLVVNSAGGISVSPCAVRDLGEALYAKQDPDGAAGAPPVLGIVPATAADVEVAMKVVYAGGNAVALVDEAGWWLTAHSRGTSSLLRVCRAWRHRGLSVLLTTQALSGDIPQTALACANRIYVFRQQAPASVKRLGELGCSRSQITRLPRHCYVTLEL